ncbi:histidine phosphatase family protein [Cryobacterium frigoriphilum]|uniref:Histidine phosphatase family protein n=1 Tax=Cryobacterium frigoriphilum TaxID=1259150 RepID=A0A4R9A8M3_9MICO|nr:histidine phosphatase family protein [Cryobacterium frigoriphilum]TFD54007.1 histidine phosphatase family protein [Cryobacterium frigoriphilum]
MRLFLIRHGQTPANVLGSLDTNHPGPGLTTLGEQQAAVIPRALENEPIDAIFASTLRRTQLTAGPLAVARGLDVQIAGGLHEIEAGELEGRNDQASVVKYMQTVFAWGAGNLDVRMPGAGTGHDFFARFDTDISAVSAELETAAVFSHGAAIRVWAAARAANVPPEFAGLNNLDNTGVVELTGSQADGWTLVSWAGMPVGGQHLADATAEDPTGDTLSAQA